MFNLLAVVSAVGCVATFVTYIAGPDYSRRWVYFATYHSRPSICDRAVEFGRLYEAQPFVVSARGYSWSEPYSLSHDFQDDRSMLGPPAIDDNYSRSVKWNLAGVRLIEGRLIPPWGWKDHPLGDPATAIRYRVVSVPVIYPIGLFALVPMAWCIARAQRARRAHAFNAANRCATCGYDLRATPDRCPECGTPVQPNPTD
jgi:hypothetical protein